MIFEISKFGILSILQIGGDVESISRTVTCTGELSALTCVIPRGEGFHTPPSRLSYLVMYTVLQLSSSPRYTFVPCLCTVLSMYWTLTMNDI